MTAFSDKTALISRQACVMVVLELPICSLVYGVGITELITGTDSDMSGANNWRDFLSLGTFNVNSTVAGKMYMLGNGGNDYATLPNVFVIGGEYTISLKAKRISGAATEIYAGTALDGSSADLTFTPTLTEATYSGTITATAVNLVIGLLSGFNGVAFTIDDVSVAKTKGCDATGSSGSECYNRWGSCQDKTNYTQTTEDLVLTSHDVVVDFPSRPYIKKLTHEQTKIGKSLTERARRTVTVLDDTADDINIDPYRTTRAAPVTGMFWKNLLARVPNYRSFPATIYSGYAGLAKSEFIEAGKGIIDKIVAGKNGTYTITIIDTFKTLSKVTFPEVIESELNTSINDTQTAIVLTSVDKANGVELVSGEYIQFDDEIVLIESVVTLNHTVGIIRGALGTIAAAHDDETKVTMVKYYPPALPIDQLRQLWQDAGNLLADLDGSWTTWDSLAANDEEIAAVITDNDKLTVNVLWWEIVELFDFNTWINEDGTVSIYRTFSNLPGRTYGELTDNAHIKENSAGISFNEISRISRVILYWQKTPTGDTKNSDSYKRITAYINEDSEKAYIDVAGKEFFSRWVTLFGLFEEDIIRSAKDIVRRKQRSWDEARHIVTVVAENKDVALKTGMEVYLETDRVGSLDGTTQRVKSLIVGRKELDHGIEFDVQVLPNRRVCFVAPNGTPTYSAATDAEKEYGFVSDSTTGLMGDGSPAYEVR